MKTIMLAMVLAGIALGGLAWGVGYTGFYSHTPANYLSQNISMMQYTWQSETAQTQAPAAPISLDQAKSIAEQYLSATRNPNLAIKEIMEFQNNFYIIYYEKDSGIGAFEMLIWKQAPSSGMMGGGMMRGYVGPGVMMPEPGPNMMWNIKYSPMNNGMMGYYGNQWPSTMAVSPDSAAQLAQAYLTSNFGNAKVEMATKFYGYYTFDFTVNGRIAGMLSVNGNTGQVWYHSWHGDFIQEVEFT